MKDLCDFAGTEKLDVKMFNSIQVTEEQGLDDSDYRLQTIFNDERPTQKSQGSNRTMNMKNLDKYFTTGESLIPLSNFAAQN